MFIFRCIVHVHLSPRFLSSTPSCIVADLWRATALGSPAGSPAAVAVRKLAFDMIKLYSRLTYTYYSLAPLSHLQTAYHSRDYARSGWQKVCLRTWLLHIRLNIEQGVGAVLFLCATFLCLNFPGALLVGYWTLIVFCLFIYELTEICISSAVEKQATTRNENINPLVLSI